MTRKAWRRSPWAAVALLSAFLIMISGTVLAAEPIRLGGVGPLSQPGTVLAGLDMKWAIETAAADINAKGGVLGRELEVIFYDTVQQGSITAILGANGVGKSTLLKAVFGLLTPEQGSIQFRGEELIGTPPYRIEW